MSGDDEPWGFHGGLQAEFKVSMPQDSIVANAAVSTWPTFFLFQPILDALDVDKFSAD
jgi:hypothetical protein